MATPLHVGTDLGSWAPCHAGLSPCPSWTWSCCRWWGGGPPRPPSVSRSRAGKNFTCELEFGFENSTKSSPDVKVEKVAQTQRKIIMFLNPGIFLTVQYIVLREPLLSVHSFTSPSIQTCPIFCVWIGEAKTCNTQKTERLFCNWYCWHILNTRIKPMMKNNHILDCFCQGCRGFETSVFFSVKINISTTGGSRVGFFQPDTNHP